MLSGVETTKEKVLRIILAGQPELNDKLNSPELVQLAQRVRLRFHLSALSESDLHAYVQHRLEVAGSQGRRSSRTTSPADLPLHRRHAAPRQHAVRHVHDVGVHEGTRLRQARRPSRGDRRTAVGRVREASQGRADHRPAGDAVAGGAGLRPADHRQPRRGSGGRAPDERRLPQRRERRGAGQDHRRHRRPDQRRAVAAARPHRHRPHGGQRPADRQPVRQPPSLRRSSRRASRA